MFYGIFSVFLSNIVSFLSLKGDSRSFPKKIEIFFGKEFSGKKRRLKFFHFLRAFYMPLWYNKYNNIASVILFHQFACFFFIFPPNGGGELSTDSPPFFIDSQAILPGFFHILHRMIPWANTEPSALCPRISLHFDNFFAFPAFFPAIR